MELLNERNTDGVVVKLYWDEPDSITITVSDNRTGEHFVVEPPADKAMDAFTHPFAYRYAKMDSELRSWQ